VAPVSPNGSLTDAAVTRREERAESSSSSLSLMKSAARFRLLSLADLVWLHPHSVSCSLAISLTRHPSRWLSVSVGFGAHGLGLLTCQPRLLFGGLPPVCCFVSGFLPRHRRRLDVCDTLLVFLLVFSWLLTASDSTVSSTRYAHRWTFLHNNWPISSGG